MFLMIENQGVAPIEAFTVLGDSGTRHRTNTGLLGQFGSGNKHGINLLLRKNIPFYIYSGLNKLTFSVKTKRITEADGTVRQSFPVVCKVSGKINRTINCGWTLDFGAMDWKETRMALREFISNCLDCSNIMGTEPVVDPRNKNVAKSGTTRIFISMADEDVKDFYMNLSKHFLHFSDSPEQVDQTFLKKNPESTGPRIYREGALVNELSASHQAAFDYNFKASEISIDECRNSSEYALRASIAKLINNAKSSTLTELFETMSEGDVYEATLDDFYLGLGDSDRQRETWKEAWGEFAGDSVIATESQASSPVAQHVKAKGHKVQVVKSDSFVKVAQKMGVAHMSSVIGQHEADGKIECAVTEDAMIAVGKVWGWCEEANMTNRKNMPVVSCFRQIMDGASECLGYHETGTDKVFLRNDISGKLALKVAIEEVAHYITGSTDGSRDFQSFAFDMIVEVCS